MVSKPSFKGIKNRDITPPSQLREQARLVQLGRLQGRAKWWQVATALAVTILFIALATVAVVRVMWHMPGIDSSKYQAVFLEDGKVFFGKLHNTNGSYVVLKKAYYTKANTSSSENASAEQTALIEVGSESYGPEADLQIARSQILFWQNLRDDSQVSTAINNKVNL